MCILRRNNLNIIFVKAPFGKFLFSLLEEFPKIFRLDI